MVRARNQNVSSNFRYLGSYPFHAPPRFLFVLSPGQNKLETRNPAFALIVLDFFQHHGEILNAVIHRRIVLEEQSRDQLPMVGVSDDEMNMPGKAAGIAREYSDETESATLIRSQLGTPAIGFMVTMVIGMNDLDPGSGDGSAASVQHSGPKEQRLAVIALSPQSRLGDTGRKVVGAGAHLPRGLPFVARLRFGLETEEEGGEQNHRRNSTWSRHGVPGA
jgi:hypothetical protein